jgi:tetratricopeptide (TPR) repeat protein
VSLFMIYDLRFMIWIVAFAMISLAPADVLHLKNGTKIEGEIKSFDGQKFILGITIGAGSAQAPYDKELVEKIELKRTPEQDALLQSQEVTSLPSLAALWEKRSIYLKVPESDAGEIGIKLIQLLLSTKKASNAKEAVSLCERIEREDWNLERRNQVKALRLEAFVRLGKTEAALDEAQKLLDLSPDNIAVIIDAKFIMAQAAAANLHELEKKNPRWTEIKARRTERQAFIQQSLDGFLYAPSFYPENMSLTARGLWSAAEVANHVGLAEESFRYAREVVNYFPDPTYLTKAQDLVKKLEKVVPADVEEVTPSTAAPAVAPPKEQKLKRTTESKTKPKP